MNGNDIYKKKLYDYLNDLWEMGRRSFDDCLQDETDILCGYLIASSKSHDRSDCILNSTNDFIELADMLAASLIYDKESSKKEIFSLLRKSTTAYWRDRIEELFEEKLEYSLRDPKYNKPLDVDGQYNITLSDKEMRGFHNDIH